MTEAILVREWILGALDQNNTLEPAANLLLPVLSQLPNIGQSISHRLWAAESNVFGMSFKTNTYELPLLQKGTVKEQLDPKWLAYINEQLAQCAETLDFVTAVSCISLLERMRAHALIGQFAKRACELVRQKDPMALSVLFGINEPQN
jgi:hypothetical protein